jgi:hypothetical protein
MYVKQPIEISSALSSDNHRYLDECLEASSSPH